MTTMKEREKEVGGKRRDINKEEARKEGRGERR